MSEFLESATTTTVTRKKERACFLLAARFFASLSLSLILCIRSRSGGPLAPASTQLSCLKMQSTVSHAVWREEGGLLENNEGRKARGVGGEGERQWRHACSALPFSKRLPTPCLFSCSCGAFCSATRTSQFAIMSASAVRREKPKQLDQKPILGGLGVFFPFFFVEGERKREKRAIQRESELFPSLRFPTNSQHKPEKKLLSFSLLFPPTTQPSSRSSILADYSFTASLVSLGGN